MYAKYVHLLGQFIQLHPVVKIIELYANAKQVRGLPR